MKILPSFSLSRFLHSHPYWKIVGALVFLSIPVLIYAASITFTERLVDGAYNTAIHAIGIDFDGDGDRDIVTCSYNGDSVDWYRNNGSQVFTKVVIDAALGSPNKIQVVDMDDDNDLDILLTDFSDGALYFFENNGSMSFASKQTVVSGIANIIDLFVGDFTGDNEKDIVAVGINTSSFALYKNDGNENFTSIAIDSAISYNLGAGDLDGDGDLDIVASNLSQNDTYWFRNSGTGSFTKILIDANVSNSRGVHIADIDDDADNDFVISAAGAGDVLWFRNSGTGSFTRFTVDSTIGGPFGLNVMDLDDDGDEDILAAGQADNDLIWYDNNGSETFTERTIDLNFGYPYWIETDDINRDGRTDVVSASYNDSDVSWWENGTAPDRIYVNSYSPKDNALRVSRTANLVLGFRESVRVGTGVLTIKKSSDGSTVEAITLSGAQMSGNGSTEITINPSVTFDNSTQYYVNWTASAFKNDAGSGVTVLNSTGRWSFKTEDTVGPTVSSVSPTDNATGISSTANLTITFNEVTRASTGTLTIKKASDDSTVETITVSGSQLTGNTSTQLTLNPAATLADSTSYYVIWSANAFEDVHDNPAAAVSSSTYWNFTTADTTGPSISGLSPADNATDVSTTANLVLTFSEAVLEGTGSVVIKKDSDSSTVEIITMTGGLVSGTGTTQITLNPANTLANGTAYYVTVSANAFEDSSGNDFAGITTATTWNFTTVASAAAAASSSSSTASAVNNTQGGVRTSTLKDRIERVVSRTSDSSSSAPVQSIVREFPLRTRTCNRVFHWISNHTILKRLNTRLLKRLGFTCEK